MFKYVQILATIWIIASCIPLFFFIALNYSSSVNRSVDFKYSWSFDNFRNFSKKYRNVFYEILFLREKGEKCLKFFFIASLLSFFKILILVFSMYYISEDFESINLKILKIAELLKFLSLSIFLFGCSLLSLYNINSFNLWRNYNESSKFSIYVFYCCLFFIYLEYISFFGSVFFVIISLLQFFALCIDVDFLAFLKESTEINNNILNIIFFTSKIEKKKVSSNAFKKFFSVSEIRIILENLNNLGSIKISKIDIDFDAFDLKVLNPSLNLDFLIEENSVPRGKIIATSRGKRVVIIDIGGQIVQEKLEKRNSILISRVRQVFVDLPGDKRILLSEFIESCECAKRLKAFNIDHTPSVNHLIKEQDMQNYNRVFKENFSISTDKDLELLKEYLQKRGKMINRIVEVSKETKLKLSGTHLENLKKEIYILLGQYFEHSHDSEQSKLVLKELKLKFSSLQYEMLNLLNEKEISEIIGKDTCSITEALIKSDTTGESVNVLKNNPELSQNEKINQIYEQMLNQKNIAWLNEIALLCTLIGIPVFWFTFITTYLIPELTSIIEYLQAHPEQIQHILDRM